MQLFDELVDEIRRDKITIGAEESQDNTWAVSLTTKQAASTSPDQVATFLEQARAAYAETATSAQRGTPLRFYAWFDEMAGQLRFSVSSVDPLPFGAPIRVVPQAREIGRQFLTSDYLDGIPWSELSEVGANDAFEEAGPTPQTLDVFVVPLFDS